MAKATREPREISAHACAILSLLIGAASLWIVFATYRAGGDWVFSVLACFVPLLFAIQGIRLSREPGTRFARFSFLGSIVGGGARRDLVRRFPGVARALGEGTAVAG